MTSDLGKLIIVSGKEVASRVEMLKEFHIRNLSQKSKLAEKVNALNDTLEQTRIIAESISEKFQVDSDLLKYVLGTKGVNIQRARLVHLSVFTCTSTFTLENNDFFRQVKGVIQIDIDDRKDNCRATISIYAETEDAAKRARQVSTDRTEPSANPYFSYRFVFRFWNFPKTTICVQEN